MDPTFHGQLGLGRRVLDLTPGPQPLRPNLFPVRLIAVYTSLFLSNDSSLLLKLYPLLQQDCCYLASLILSDVL